MKPKRKLKEMKADEDIPIIPPDPFPPEPIEADSVLPWWKKAIKFLMNFIRSY